MSGIAGIIAPGIENYQQVIDRMSGMLVGHPYTSPFSQPLAETKTVDAAVFAGGALASVSLRAVLSPLANRADPRFGRVWLAVYGTVALSDGPPDPTARPLSEQLLDLYLRGGQPALCGLNGSYVLAVYEERKARLTLIRDRHGASRLFYWHSGARLMFASEHKAISWHPSFPQRIDSTAVADLFLYRSPVGNRTIFSDIHLLPPASVLIFQDGEASTHTYWQPPFADPGSRELSDEIYADEMYERMRAAVARRARPDTCLLITGGLDSRIVAGIYQQVAPEMNLQSVTLGGDGGSDVQHGRTLAHALNIPHHHLPIDTGYLAAWAPYNIWKAEGKNGAYASWIQAAAPFYQQRGFHFALTGLYGNHISGRAYSPELLKAGTHAEGQRAVESQLHPYYEQLQGIMRPEVFRSAAANSVATLSRAYQDALPENILQRADWVNFYLRISCQANTEASLSDAAMAQECYLDNDVFDYAVARIHPKARARGLFNQLLVIRHIPAAAKIPMNKNGLLLAQDVAVRSSAIRTALRENQDRLARVLRRTLPLPPPKSELPPDVPHAEAIRSGSRDFVTGLLNDEDYYQDYFDPNAVQNMLADHLERRKNHYMTLDALVTFILLRKIHCA